MIEKDSIEVYLEVKFETSEGMLDEGAFLCTDGTSEFWLPKSQIDWTHIKDNGYEFIIPEWLAMDKGII